MIHKFGGKSKVDIYQIGLPFQNKAIKNYKFVRDPVISLYKVMEILNLSDNIRINNFLFVFDDL